MVIKVTNNPGIKDVTWNINDVKYLIPIKVLNNIGIKFSSESNYKVLHQRKLKITELTLYAKVTNSIEEDMTFMPLSEFFLEVQYTLEEPTDTIVDIFMSAVKTEFSESDLLLIATHNFCSLLKKVFERLCDMPKKEASVYFHIITNRYGYRNPTGKVGNWIYFAIENALYLQDSDCKKQYENFLNA